MKTNIIIITAVFLMFFNSCSENNQSINKETEKYHTLPNSEIEQLNETIKSKNLNSEEDIMAFYRPKKAFEEGNYSYTMQSKKIDEFTKEITLINEKRVN